MRSWNHGKEVFYETDRNAFTTTSAGLLGTNRQLKYETEAVLVIEPLKFKMDIGVMQGRSLWPTWSCIPVKRKVVDIVEATYQGRGPGKPCFARWRGGDGGPPPFVWWFYSILEQFVDRGVVQPHHERNQSDFTGISNIPRQPAVLVRQLHLKFVDSDHSYVYREA